MECGLEIQHVSRITRQIENEIYVYSRANTMKPP
jgi:hypothetical protein